MKSKLPKINLSNDELKTTYKENLEIMFSLKATDLLKASGILETHCMFFDTVKNKLEFSQDKPNLSSIILMLRGMSLECLFKKLLTKQGKMKVNDGALILPKEYTTHDLTNMARDIAGLNLNKNEAKTIICLGKYIELARLPPKNALSQPHVLMWTLNTNEKAFHTILEKISLL